MIRFLENMAKILDKAVAQANARNMPLSELLEARLAPDMHPFPRQIQIASDVAKMAGRLAGMEPPSFPDTEATFPELQARIATGGSAGGLAGTSVAPHCSPGSPVVVNLS